MGRSIMSGLHGMWSVGTLAGSAAGTLAAHTDLDARTHFALATAVLIMLSVLACRWILEPLPRADEEPPPHFALPPKAALLIGAVGFCAVFAEGASLDWSAVYLRDVMGSSPGLAAACTTGFALTMAIARLLGDVVVERLGAVRTVRLSGVLATLGGVLIITAAGPAQAMAGFGLLGLGIAVVVPVVFTAAAKSGSAPSQAIAGVATIMYASGLVAPAAIGQVADLTSLTVSFGLVTVLAVGLIAGASLLRTRPSNTPAAAGAPDPAPTPKADR
jgi:fucose permease